MEKATHILFSLIFLFILLGSPSYMVLGQVQKCTRAQDCDPASCKRGILSCMGGKCICDEPPIYLTSDGSSRTDVKCKKDSDCPARCPPKCVPICIIAACFCTGPPECTGNMKQI
ncbi:uncharacterized protein LOC132060842 [Lycium ferocissimum]|uniref:uncharacterized protein LOC132060842 n=1 Tax=Lycium ferocissimum TaxID=112874 RepID=UPI0028155F64|nr:uncharacterized protein LOC132060842 [Lycium ferocissimum]